MQLAANVKIDDYKKQTIRELEFELDYQLAWLNLYLENKDIVNIQKVKSQLRIVHEKLTKLNYF